jgi:hypothetical protein
MGFSGYAAELKLAAIVKADARMTRQLSDAIEKNFMDIS